MKEIRIQTSEKTRFVIAKDGMVVTIEGSDEAKAKELATRNRTKVGSSRERREERRYQKLNQDKKINQVISMILVFILVLQENAAIPHIL